MDTRRLDDLAKRLAISAPRRRFLRGLGALGIGSLGVLGPAGEADAAVGPRCPERCRRRCENRGPRCLARCLKHRCEDGD